MRTPTPADLLDAWDAGAAMNGPQRVSPLLQTVVGGADDLGALSIGEHDRLLVEARKRLFGETLRAVTECRSCGTALELELAAAQLLSLSSAADSVEVRSGRYQIRCRLLRIGDLVDAASAGSAEAARTLLVSRAVLSAHCDGQPIPASAMPDTVLAEVAGALGSADPLADMELPIRCECCGGKWVAMFDIASYLWHELDAWARRQLRDVHTLAGAYGWPEADILALSPIRRRYYLELVVNG